VLLMYRTIEDKMVGEDVSPTKSHYETWEGPSDLTSK
jgi:hypothetical protein